MFELLFGFAAIIFSFFVEDQLTRQFVILYGMICLSCGSILMEIRKRR